MQYCTTRLILTLAVLCFAATSASALDIDVEFNLGNSSTANAVTVHAPNNITVVPTNGDVFAFDVIVSNAPMETVTAIFASLVTDVTQLTFLGGGFSNILTEATCTGLLCAPATLAPGLSESISKPNDPESFGTGNTEWIQAVAHTNPGGANGAGPDVAVLLGYTYIGAGGFDLVTIGAAITAGDAIAGIAGTANFSGAIINSPDGDGDGVLIDADNCPSVSNTDQANLDADPFGDVCDNCAGIANPGQEDLDLDGIGDVCDPDRDGDLVPNQFDDFPDDPNEFGDIDSDGIGDNSDNCQGDANPGQEDQDGDLIGDVCDPDRDGDGTLNVSDTCPIVSDPGQEDTDGNGTGDACNDLEDIDGDEWADALDNCSLIANPDQNDMDSNGVGDACEVDFDGDGVPGEDDNCPVDANPGQEDTDNNGTGDACNTFEDSDGDEWADALDNCSVDANPGQEDTDGNGTGDACNSFEDSDGDEFSDALDNCPADFNSGQEDTDSNGTGDACNDFEDTDGDDWADALDNCLLFANPDQLDLDNNGIGDICELDADGDGLSDLVETQTGVFIDENDTGTDPLNPDTDGDGLTDGVEVLDYGSDPFNPDTDADTVIDGSDNCVLVANLDQADADGGADDDLTSFLPIDHYGDRCDADTNNDGIVNTADFFGDFRPCFGLLVSSNSQCASSDFDGSGTINTGDFFAYFLPQFGGEPGPGRTHGLEFNFTTCGQTGSTGPSQAQCDSAYVGTDLQGAVTVVGGIQEWGVPVTGTFTIEALGAQGGFGSSGDGGLNFGASMSGQFSLAAGQTIRVLVGQMGGVGTVEGGGGGAAFVVQSPYASTGDILVIAGGGGGTFESNFAVSSQGTINNCSQDNGLGSSCDGSGGNSDHVGSGAGFLGVGRSLTHGCVPAQSFIGGGGGGHSCDQNASNPFGGFGGGGATVNNDSGGGGGGGFSGGPAGLSHASSGGGGGSFNAGTSQANASGVNAGPGQVTITFLAPLPAAALAATPALTPTPEPSSADAAFLESFSAATDEDGDGLGAATEALLGTDPQNPDTDSDGVSDGAEVLAETDPLDPASFSNQPAAVPASSLGVRLFLALLLLLGAGRIVHGRTSRQA